MNLQAPLSPRHAFGFLPLGSALWLWPSLSPDSFPATAWGGTNGRALWLDGMGLILLAIGLVLTLRSTVVPSLERWATARKAAAGSPSFALSRLRSLGRF